MDVLSGSPLFSECLYADNSVLVGGDIDALDEWSAVPSTAACIDLCREREGCKYWTITKGGADSRCQLKAWRGVLEKREGYISGSLPSACCEYDITLYALGSSINDVCRGITQIQSKGREVA